MWGGNIVSWLVSVGFGIGFKVGILPLSRGGCPKHYYTQHATFWGVKWPILNERRRLDVASLRGKMGNHAAPMPCGAGSIARGIPTRPGACWSAAIENGPPKHRHAPVAPTHGLIDLVGACATGLMRLYGIVQSLRGHIRSCERSKRNTGHWRGAGEWSDNG